MQSFANLEYNGNSNHKKDLNTGDVMEIFDGGIIWFSSNRPERG